MNRYNKLKTCANIMRVVAVIIFVIVLLAAFVFQGIDLLLTGFISSVWLFGWGEALLALADIAQSTAQSLEEAKISSQANQVTAKAMMGMYERKVKARPGNSGKPSGLPHVNPEKRRSA